MSAKIPPAVAPAPAKVGLPPPDSPGGVAVMLAVMFGIAYALLFVGAYSALCAEALWVVTLNLILGVLVSFFLAAQISSARARATNFELEFARTVEAHRAANHSLVEASPLGGILTAYARAAQDQRHAARAHSYAAGPAVYSTGAALVATLLIGLANVAGNQPDLVGIAVFVELFAFVLLVLSTGLLALSVGQETEVVEFEAFVLRRWARVTKPSFAFRHALASTPWVPDLLTDEYQLPWQETGSPRSDPA